jgi:hypothetical protein
MAFRACRAVALAAVLVIALSSLSLAAQRVVLFEQGTEWGCVPCFQASATVHQIRTNFGSQLASSKWHCWWPAGNDPWYHHNPTPVQTRIGYYGINGIPDICIDGAGAGNGVPPSPFSYAEMANAINARLALPSPIGIINTTGVIQGNDMNLSFDVNVESPQVGNDFRLFVIVTEETIPNNNPNGETNNYDVFRRSNANTGEPISLATGGIQHFNRTIPYHASYNILNLHAVVFVANYATKEVLNAAEFNIAVPFHFNYAHVGAPVKIGGPNDVVTFLSSVINNGANNDVYDVSVTGVPNGWSYSYTTPQGTFSGPSTLPLAANESAQISLSLNSQGNPGSGTAEINLISQGDPLNALSLEFQKINGMNVLLVDDDGADSRETVYAPSLDAAGVTWARWDIGAWGTLNAQDLLNAADAVIWYCGLQNPSITPSERTAITAFLADGRDLFINGPDVGYSLADPASPNYSVESLAWFQDTLHANYLTNFIFSSTISGAAGDPISDGLSQVVLNGFPYSPGLMDGLSPRPGADWCFTFHNQVNRCGIRYDGGQSQVVYFSFPWECLPLASQRDQVMARILEYFGATAGIEQPTEISPVMTTLSQNTPNPFNPDTMIEYTLGQDGDVNLRVYDLNGRMVRELVNQGQAASRYQVAWDGRDDTGRELASGVYFYQLTAPGVKETRRMVLTK